jgi:hypothetical protein
MLVAGLDTPVPPEIVAVVPAPVVPSSTQVVTKVNTVAEEEALTRMNSGVYGADALLSWNKVAGVPVS